MPLRHSSLNDANSPGTASEQGVAAWGVDGDEVLIYANTDVAYVQPAYGVIINVLDNDIGNGLTVTSVTVRDPSDGEAETNGTTVTYLTDEHFNALDCGESTQVTLDYAIRDAVGRTATGFIQITIERPLHFWADEDGSIVLDEDGAAISFCPAELYEWWIDEDEAVIVDESGDHVLTLEE